MKKLDNCLTSQFELLEQANAVDYGLHHEEKPRFSWWAYFWENFEFKFMFQI